MPAKPRSSVEEERRAPQQMRIEQLLLETRSAKMSQEDLAQRLYHPQSFVSIMETGERHLTLPEIEEICGVFGVSLSTFFAGISAA